MVQLYLYQVLRYIYCGKNAFGVLTIKLEAWNSKVTVFAIKCCRCVSVLARQCLHNIRPSIAVSLNSWQQKRFHMSDFTTNWSIRKFTNFVTWFSLHASSTTVALLLDLCKWVEQKGWWALMGLMITVVPNFLCSADLRTVAPWDLPFEIVHGNIETYFHHASAKLSILLCPFLTICFEWCWILSSFIFSVAGDSRAVFR